MPGARLRAVSPAATPEEVAAIVAAIALSGGPEAPAAPEPGSAWVRAGRLAASRAGLQRGPWRLSGRIGRRSRA